MNIVNIPNTLTISRIVLIPAFITCVVYAQNRLALLIFAVAAVTDLLDGFFARLTNQKTPLGTFLDPLADKFLLVSSFILFAVYGWIPTWLAITVISRDIIVVTGWLLLYLLTNTAKVETVRLGKAAIALQLITIAYVLLRVNVASLPPLHTVLFPATAALTAISGLQYVYRGFTVTHVA